MDKVNFSVTSQTVPYVEMVINNKRSICIPAGTALNIFEKIIKNKSKLITVDGIDVSAAYDPLDEKMYIEQRADTCINSNFLVYSECKYKLKRYIDLYKSIVDLIKYSHLYYDNYKVFAITLDKSIDISVETVLNGRTEIYIGKSIKHVYSQFNKVHPYLLDSADQCNIRALTEEEVAEICQNKLNKFMDLI